MEQLTLPRQSRAEAVLRAAAARNALSHALLITGGGDRLAAARFAAAALLCSGEGSRPCGRCAHCRKVMGGIHPDVTVVEDPEHKNIAVDIVRAIRADAHIRPNEGSCKVYLFPDCTILPEAGQNVLLKVVEEGPAYAAFIFCAESAAAVLQTIRSRCVELRLLAEEDPQESAIVPAAQELCRVLAAKKRGAVVAFAVHLEKKKVSRDDLAALLEDSRRLFTAALLAQYGAEVSPKEREMARILGKNLTKVQIMRTIELLQKYHGECSYNVGPGHVLGALAAELEGIL